MQDRCLVKELLIAVIMLADSYFFNALCSLVIRYAPQLEHIVVTLIETLLFHVSFVETLVTFDKVQGLLRFHLRKVGDQEWRRQGFDFEEDFFLWFLLYNCFLENFPCLSISPFLSCGFFFEVLAETGVDGDERLKRRAEDLTFTDARGSEKL